MTAIKNSFGITWVHSTHIPVHLKRKIWDKDLLSVLEPYFIHQKNICCPFYSLSGHSLLLNLFSWECDLLCYNLWNMICNILGTFRTGLTQIKLSSPVKIQDRKLISDISLGIHQADINFDWNIWRTCWSLLYSF